MVRENYQRCEFGPSRIKASILFDRIYSREDAAVTSVACRHSAARVVAVALHRKNASSGDTHPRQR